MTGQAEAHDKDHLDLEIGIVRLSLPGKEGTAEAMRMHEPGHPVLISIMMHR
jgi:hypothetical protein